jgi:hypothetical protein
MRKWIDASKNEINSII